MFCIYLIAKIRSCESRMHQSLGNTVAELIAHFSPIVNVTLYIL